MSFKWTHDFKKRLLHQSITEVAATENMLTRCQVLKHLGLSLADFKTQQQAFDYADVEIAKNKAEFDHEGLVEKSDSGAMHDRFLFVVGHGKKRTWRQMESKELTGSATCNSVNGLREAKAFMECLGPVDVETSATTPACKNLSDEEKILTLNLTENRPVASALIMCKYTTN